MICVHTCKLYYLYHRLKVCYYSNKQEYIIEKRESVLLQYGTVLQPFTGVTTFVMIFTNLGAHSLFPYDCNGVDLSSLCVYHSKATVMHVQVCLKCKL